MRITSIFIIMITSALLVGDCMNKTNPLITALSILIISVAALIAIIPFAGQAPIRTTLQQANNNSSLNVPACTTLLRKAACNPTEQSISLKFMNQYNSMKSKKFVLPTAQYIGYEEDEIEGNNSTENNNDQSLQRALQILQSIGNGSIGEDILSQLRELGLNEEQIEMIQNFPSSNWEDQQMPEEDANSQQSSPFESETHIIPDNHGNWQQKNSDQKFSVYLLLIVAITITMTIITILYIIKHNKRK